MIFIDASQLGIIEKAVRDIKNGVPRVLTPAINRALAKGRTTVKREIRKVYLIKAKDIPLEIAKASYSRPVGGIRVQQGMLPLGLFKVTPRRVQGARKRMLKATVKIGRGGLLPHAFNVDAGGYIGPFQRTGKSRLPIRKLMTIGASIMASQPNVGPNVEREMEETLAKRLDHELERVLATAGGK